MNQPIVNNQSMPLSDFMALSVQEHRDVHAHAVQPVTAKTSPKAANGFNRRSFQPCSSIRQSSWTMMM